jgi:hypothetical protein
MGDGLAFPKLPPLPLWYGVKEEIYGDYYA